MRLRTEVLILEATQSSNYARIVPTWDRIPTSWDFSLKSYDLTISPVCNRTNHYGNGLLTGQPILLIIEMEKPTCITPDRDSTPGFPVINDSVLHKSNVLDHATMNTEYIFLLRLQLSWSLSTVNNSTHSVRAILVMKIHFLRTNDYQHRHLSFHGNNLRWVFNVHFLNPRVFFFFGHQLSRPVVAYTWVAELPPTGPSTPDRDILVIGSLVYCESSALDRVAIEAGGGGGEKKVKKRPLESSFSKSMSTNTSYIVSAVSYSRQKGRLSHVRLNCSDVSSYKRASSEIGSGTTFFISSLRSIEEHGELSHYHSVDCVFVLTPCCVVCRRCVLIGSQTSRGGTYQFELSCENTTDVGRVYHFDWGVGWGRELLGRVAGVLSAAVSTTQARHNRGASPALSRIPFPPTPLPENRVSGSLLAMPGTTRTSPD
uniref:Uncharacterized protein n=1 Tax=Timema cristinae TaxID=61476 RepID=A0A7R9GYR0_TIMCR|nr:unnamed protein product [Timema cristinae]